MKFGVFYEHQLPKPWAPGDEAKLFHDALEQVVLADKLHNCRSIVRDYRAEGDALWQRFTEKSANSGSLGIMEAKYLIRHMQANAKMFAKFGA